MTIPVKAKTTYAIELLVTKISELSRKAQETFRRQTQVNFWSSQMEAFIYRKVSNQFVIIFNAKIFILIRKKWSTIYFIPTNVAGFNFVK